MLQSHLFMNLTWIKHIKTFLNGSFPRSFYFILVLLTQLKVNECSLKILNMAGFDSWTPGVGSNCSANWATTTAQDITTYWLTACVCLDLRLPYTIRSWFCRRLTSERLTSCNVVWPQWRRHKKWQIVEATKTLRTLKIIFISMLSSVTKWPGYFSILGHLYQRKFAQKHKNFQRWYKILPNTNLMF